MVKEKYYLADFPFYNIAINDFSIITGYSYVYRLNNQSTITQPLSQLQLLRIKFYKLKCEQGSSEKKQQILYKLKMETIQQSPHLLQSFFFCFFFFYLSQAFPFTKYHPLDKAGYQPEKIKYPQLWCNILYIEP